MSKKIIINNNITSLNDFIRELNKIEKMGYVQAHRSGPTAIGKTLEDLLGIEENCISTPDLGNVELKSARLNSNSMLTLTTKSPDTRGANSWLRDNYGYKTNESILINPNLNILHSTLNGQNFNSLNGRPYLKLAFKNDKMYVEHAKDGILEKVFWSENTLAKAFKSKYPQEKLYYVKADTKVINGVEYFHYKEAYYLQNFSAEKMLENIKSGIIEIDIRIGMYPNGVRKGASHDHGTGIRIRQDKLELCFESKKKIL